MSESPATAAAPGGVPQRFLDRATPEAEAAAFRAVAERLRGEVTKLIVGHARALDDLLAALFAGGHVLIEGVPGIGKTRLVGAVARALSLSFKRIQFTPDLMPGDITGSDVLREPADATRGAAGSGPGDADARTASAGQGRFRFEPGPVFAQVVLADEINRATPKTQAALLEAMQEGAVTSAGVRHELPRPFFVLATQNPIEMTGTYPLPEAQLDRFMLKLVLGMPSQGELVSIIERTTEPEEPRVEAVASAEDVLRMQALARAVPVSSGVREYASRLVLATHPSEAGSCELVRRYVRYGASPRAAQALVLCGKVRALMAGRMHVGFSDVRASCASALRHRLVLNLEARSSGVSPDAIVSEVVDAVREG